MPIHIQRIGPEPGLLPSVAPFARATGEGAAVEAFGGGVARAGQQLGGALIQAGTTTTAIAADLLQIQKHLEAEDAKLDMQEQAGQLKQAYLLREQQIRETGQVDAKDYPQVMSGELDRMVRESTARLKYPQTARQYQIALQPFVTEQKVGALHQGIKLQHAQLDVVESDLQARDAQTAVFGATPEDRANAYERGLTRVFNRVNTGRTTQGPAELKAFRGQIERGSVYRDYTNPALRGQVVDLLMSGGYPNIPAAEQLQLAQTLHAKDEAERRRQDAEAEKQAKKNYDAEVSSLYARAADKSLTEDELREATRRLTLSREDQAALRTEMTRPVEDKPSDVPTLERVTADVHSMRPRMTESDLLSLRQQGLLSYKDWRAALDRRRETIEGLQVRGLTIGMQRHNQAEQELRAALGIPTIFDKLDPAKEKAWSLALPELRRRSSAFGGSEDPLTVTEAIIPRYRQMLDAGAQLTADQAQKAAGVSSGAELDALKASGRIGDVEYQTRRRLLLDAERARQQQEIEVAGRKLQQNLKKALGGKTPKTGAGAVD
jgi:hypothetical protein